MSIFNAVITSPAKLVEMYHGVAIFAVSVHGTICLKGNLGIISRELRDCRSSPGLLYVIEFELFFIFFLKSNYFRSK